MSNRNLFRAYCFVLSTALCFLGPSSLQAELAVDPLEEDTVPSGPQPQGPPLTLDDCYQLALIQSETVAIQKEAISKASAAMFTAASEALPDVNFVITRELQDQQEGSGVIASTTTSGGVNDPDISQQKFTIRQPLFQGFKATGALLGAGSYKTEQKETWIRDKQVLYQNVAHAFYNVLQYRKNLRIIREIHDLLRERIRELEEREKIGRSRASEVATAWTGLKALEAELAGTKGIVASAQFLLEFWIGTGIQGRKLQEEDGFDLSSKDLKEYLELVPMRPDVKAAERAIRTAWSGLVVAQSGFWPTIFMDHTQYMRREGALGGVDWDLLFTVDVPLFSGTATVGAVKDAVSTLKQKKLSFSLARRQAELEIKRTYEEWRFSKTQYFALKEAVAAAEKNYQLQNDEYRRSLVNNLDVLNALQSLHNNRRNENEAFYQMKFNEAEFRVAIGEVP